MIWRRLLFLFLSNLILDAVWAQEPYNEDCLQANTAAAERISDWIAARGSCNPGCRGCGCNGGPGYRNFRTGECVSWSALNEMCGPPPHNDCAKECTQANLECRVPDELFQSSGSQAHDPADLADPARSQGSS